MKEIDRFVQLMKDLGIKHSIDGSSLDSHENRVMVTVWDIYGESTDHYFDSRTGKYLKTGEPED